MESNLGRTLTLKSSRMLLSMIVASMLSLLTSIVSARSLGATFLGLYAIIASVQSIVFLFAEFGLGTAIPKLIAENRIRNPSQAMSLAKVGFYLVISFSVISSIIYVLISYPIGVWLYGNPLITELIPLSALAVISGALLLFVSAIAQGCQNIRILARSKISVAALMFILVLLLVPSLGIVGLFLSSIFTQIAISLIIFRAIDRAKFNFTSAKVQTDPRHAKNLIVFAFPSMLSAAFVGPIFWFGTTELALIVDLQAVGYFAISLAFYQMLILIPQSIVIPLMPTISELSAGSSSGLKPFIERTLNRLSFFLFIPMVIVLVFSDSFVSILYGSDYSSASDIVSLMSIAAYLSALSAISGAVLIGMSRIWSGLALNAIWALVFVTFILALIPTLGIIGLGITYSVSYGILFFASSFLMVRKYGLNLNKTYKRITLVLFLLLMFYLLRHYFASIGIFEQALLIVICIASLIALLHTSRSEILTGIRYLRYMLLELAHRKFKLFHETRKN